MANKNTKQVRFTNAEKAALQPEQEMTDLPPVWWIPNRGKIKVSPRRKSTYRLSTEANVYF